VDTELLIYSGGRFSVVRNVSGHPIQGHMIVSDGGPLGPNFLFATDG